MIITKLSAQKNNPDRVNVFIDNQYSFSLSINQIVEEKLKLNQEIDSQKLKYYQKISEQGKQKIKALEWLMLRPHSVKEFNTYLYKKNIDSEVGKSWQQEFINFGYLDDNKFAIFWIENRKRKNKSNKFITSELRGKGVSTEIINDNLKANQLSDDESLKELIKSKKKLSRYQDETKLTRYLLSKGFAYSRIKALLAEDKF